MIIFLLFVGLIVVIAVVIRLASGTPSLDDVFGPVNPQMICPHCSTTGDVRTKSVTQKKGISGGKATAALMTAGVSLLATGLSRKETNTQAHCTNCKNTWFF